MNSQITQKSADYQDITKKTIISNIIRDNNRVRTEIIILSNVNPTPREPNHTTYRS